MLNFLKKLMFWKKNESPQFEQVSSDPAPQPMVPEVEPAVETVVIELAPKKAKKGRKPKKVKQDK